MNSTEPHNDATTSAAKTTDELCSLFSTTVSSLASDAAALQQIKSLGICILNENDHPNDSSSIREGLVEVNNIVTELEGKVRMLQEIVAEEQQSLKEMSSVKKAAEEQHEVLQEMLQACHVAIQQQENEQKEALVAAPSSRNTASGATTSRQHQVYTTTDVPATTHSTDTLLESGAKRVSRRRDSVDPRDKRHSNNAHTHHSPLIHLERVSEMEWNCISRTVRGRITLAVVNDALRDIERVFHKKYSVLAHHTDKGTPVELQQKLLNSHRELHVKEHGDSKWVSEQDLRQCCAFFRNGESTARQILFIIRTLRRLKQVPAKHSQVTYVCES